MSPVLINKPGWSETIWIKGYNKVHYGIPETTVNAIQVLYSNSSSAVIVNGSISDPFDVTTGVLQGDVLAPFLFIILVDYILGKASGPDSGVVAVPRQSRRYPAKMLNDLDFADDIALDPRIFNVSGPVPAH